MHVIYCVFNLLLLSSPSGPYKKTHHSFFSTPTLFCLPSTLPSAFSKQRENGFASRCLLISHDYLRWGSRHLNSLSPAFQTSLTKATNSLLAPWPPDLPSEGWILLLCLHLLECSSSFLNLWYHLPLVFLWNLYLKFVSFVLGWLLLVTYRPPFTFGFSHLFTL